MEGTRDLDFVKVAVLEEKVGNMESVVDHLDETIEKISSLNVNISRMIAVHEEKFSMTKRVTGDLTDDFAKLEEKVKSCSGELSARISALEKKLFIASGIVLAFTFLFNAGLIQNNIPTMGQSSAKIESPR
jgi:hypothetical protein